MQNNYCFSKTQYWHAWNVTVELNCEVRHGNAHRQEWKTKFRDEEAGIENVDVLVTVTVMIMR